MNDHSSLHRAKANKEDEFYTKWGDISNELQHYTNEFIGKKIHLPCDTDDSHFVMYFNENENVTHSCEDFRDQDWSNVDVIVTNPPFSLFRELLHKIDRVWTYHCPWDEDREQFIAISADGKLVTNIWSDEGAVTSFVDIESNFDDCMNVIDGIRENCIMKTKTNSMIEIEEHKCVSDKKEEWRESALKHPINKEDDEAIHNIPWAMETFLGLN